MLRGTVEGRQRRDNVARRDRGGAERELANAATASPASPTAMSRGSGSRQLPARWRGAAVAAGSRHLRVPSSPGIRRPSIKIARRSSSTLRAAKLPILRNHRSAGTSKTRPDFTDAQPLPQPVALQPLEQPVVITEARQDHHVNIQIGDPLGGRGLGELVLVLRLGPWQPRIGKDRAQEVRLQVDPYRHRPSAPPRPRCQNACRRGPRRDRAPSRRTHAVVGLPRRCAPARRRAARSSPSTSRRPLR